MLKVSATWIYDLFVNGNSPPDLLANKAIYGHPRGPTHGRGAFDVTEQIQARVDSRGGHFLEIRDDESLTEIFGDPQEGKEKELSIDYELMGQTGEAKGLEVFFSVLVLLTPNSILYIAYTNSMSMGNRSASSRPASLHMCLMSRRHMENF